MNIIRLLVGAIIVVTAYLIMTGPLDAISIVTKICMAILVLFIVILGGSQLGLHKVDEDDE